TELEALPGAGHTVLLPFLDARIRREKPVFLQLLAQLRVVLDQRPRNSEAHGARLPVHAAADDGCKDVELFSRFRQQKRPAHLGSERVGREVLVELSMVDGDGALARAKENAGGGSLAAARCVIFDACQDYATSIPFGCWAECGWSAPAYTFS